jgi:O-acetyl-ADP-ribose deacetylase (regulator of RNase III)
MIEYSNGDIFTSGAEAIVNPVNCVGIMGGGLAADFKARFKGNYQRYRRACDAEEVKPGEMFIIEEIVAGTRTVIFNFPTKFHWRNDSKIEWIESGLRALVEEVKKREIKSIAIPALGCGLGGLKWNDVRPLIEGAGKMIPEVRVIIFPPKENHD